MNIEMKYLAALLFIVASLSLRAEDKSYIYQMSVTNNAGITQEDTLVFGIQPTATDTVDLALGEEDLPSIAPFGNIYGVFKIFTQRWYEATPSDHWSYKEFRYYKPTRGDSIVYNYSVYNQDLKTTFAWTTPGNELDSAFITDANGEMFRINMKTQKSATIDLLHMLVRDYRIVLYFNPEYYTPVAEEITTEGLEAFYSSQRESVVWNTQMPLAGITVYNSLGEKCFIGHGANTSGAIDASTISKGVFFVEFVFASGQKQVKKFIKY